MKNIKKTFMKLTSLMPVSSAFVLGIYVKLNDSGLDIDTIFRKTP